MKKLRNITKEISKYPYCAGEDDNKDYLSDKVCRYTIRIRKKTIKSTRYLILFFEALLILMGILPMTGAVGTPQLTPALSRTNSLSKQEIIDQVIREIPADIDFTEREIDQLYHLAVQSKHNPISQEEFITKISNLRGGDFVDVVEGLAIAAAFIIMLAAINQANAFVPNPYVIVPPHLQWLYGNNYKPGQFGYGKGVGPRSITVIGLTQNAGSEKKHPSSGSWDYKEVMRELERQSSKRSIDIQVGDLIHTLKNPYQEGPYELGDNLANQIYDSIRESDTDICDIAQNLGFKADNIKNVKDHVFYNEHHLDRYGPDQIERKQFDPNLQQALAWKRLETGNHSQDDVTWIKHECAERHHELKYNSGYNEAHNRAQTHFDGAPWENQF